MTTRRSMLAGLAAAVTGVAGLALGSGAFSSASAERGLNVEIVGDDEGLLRIVPSGVDSDVVDIENGQFVFDAVSASPSATLTVGLLGDVDFDSPGTIDEEAFTVRNDGTSTVALSFEIEEDSTTDIGFKLLVTDDRGEPPEEADNTGEIAEISGVGPGDELYGGFVFESAAATDEFDGTLTISADTDS